MTEPKECPLRWEFDQRGRWDAVSQIMDPDMTDEDQDTLCREWCLSWTICVDEQGRFCVDESDRLLWRECEKTFSLRQSVCDGSVLRALNQSFESLRSRIQTIEDHLRALPAFNSGEKIQLLPAEVYNR